METGVLFYELEHPYIYEDSMFHSYYILAAESCIQLYVLRDHPFQHPLDNPYFDPDAPYEFLLSWLHPDTPDHPFSNGLEYSYPAQPVNQAAPEPTEPAELASANDYIPAFSPKWKFSPEPIVPPSLGAQLEDQSGLPREAIAPIYVNRPVFANGSLHEDVSSDSNITKGTGDIIVIPNDDNDEKEDLDENFEEEDLDENFEQEELPLSGSNQPAGEPHENLPNSDI
ncbi:hypothetical protein AHAS_Ahas13G0209100 [Arachis hypogaea]